MAKEIDRDKLRQTLYQGHFAQPGQELSPGEPVTVTQMILDIDQIKAYDRNPRKAPNPRYDEIKASIRAQRGLNNALEVTRRPGDEVYMVRAGGNTRLKALRELAEETSDPTFRTVHCLYHPWDDDAHVLTAHLVENELRGEMTLIDKAVALQQLRSEFEAEAGGELSRSAFQRRLQDVGYTVSRPLLRRFEYAAATLLPAIPQALEGGLGGSTVEQIRQLHTAAAELWTAHEQPEDQLQIVWEQALAATDAPDWDLEVGRQQLERDLAETLDVPLREIRLELDTRLRQQGGPNSARQTVAPSAPASESPEQEPVPQQTPSSGTPPATAGTEHIDATPAGPGEHANAEPASASATITEDARDAPNEPELADPSTYGSEWSDEESPGHGDAGEPSTTPGEDATVSSLRRDAFLCAEQLARRYKLDIYLKRWDYGMGFLMDLPPPEDVLRDPSTPQSTRRQWVWWLLTVWSEALEESKAAHAPFPERFELGRVINHGNDQALHYRVGSPMWAIAAADWWSCPNTPEDDFEDLLQLMRTCRRLAQCAAASGEALWRDES
ncbi:hypothetical protein QWY84_15945 [Aquisalimonas lutea]|uniref:ParB family protein n=1 Tax=Aquisalimonas lutea TaxID=1327750 RepID=UPI0025B489DD|nr:ParB family protein [Aquisalimonas lutea]MDN3519108.1 hypothetical protein [Aquisalimonas lutea]